MGSIIDSLALGFSVAFSPGINEWKGRREVQLEIKDFQVPAEAEQARTA